MRGDAAEDRALAYLRSRGLTLVARNWRSKAGELDLVMDDGGAVAVVEVRQRSRTEFGSAEETVDARKQRRIARATRLFLAQHPHLCGRPLRFDVVALNGSGAIRWLRGAFEAED